MKAKNPLVVLLLAIVFMGQAAFALDIEGKVMVGGQPVRGASVTLWRTAGKKSPESLRQVSTDAGGGFARQLRVTGDIASAKDIDTARLTKFVNDLEMALEKPIKLSLSQLPTVTARSKYWSKQKQ